MGQAPWEERHSPVSMLAVLLLPGQESSLPSSISLGFREENTSHQKKMKIILNQWEEISKQNPSEMGQNL